VASPILPHFVSKATLARADERDLCIVVAACGAPLTVGSLLYTSAARRVACMECRAQLVSEERAS
jgi:hypothetical protein